MEICPRRKLRANLIASISDGMYASLFGDYNSYLFMNVGDVLCLRAFNSFVVNGKIYEIHDNIWDTAVYYISRQCIAGCKKVIFMCFLKNTFLKVFYFQSLLIKIYCLKKEVQDSGY